LPSLRDVFTSLFDKFGKPKHITLIETVSPNLECLRFIRHLFEIFEVTYKHQWFQIGDIGTALEYNGLKPSTAYSFEQNIEIGSWLEKFNLANDIKSEAQKFIMSASEPVKEKLKITCDNKGNACNMLRLQEIIQIDLT